MGWICETPVSFLYHRDLYHRAHKENTDSTEKLFSLSEQRKPLKRPLCALRILCDLCGKPSEIPQLLNHLF